MNFGSPDLGAALLWVAIFIVVVAALTMLTVWRAKRRGSTTIALDAAAGAARAWLAIVILGVVLAVWRWVSSEVWIDDLPARLAWATQPTCGEVPAGAGPLLNCASVDSVSASIANLSSGIRVLLGLGDLLGLATSALPAVLVIVLVGQSLKGTPFTQVAARAFAWTAGALLVLGTAADLVVQIGRSLAANEVLPPPGGGAELTSQGVFNLIVPLWPAGAALALAALAVVFRYGSRLQRDTEGLV